ncbi:spore coat U domain-containing protein [Stenotrophomonas sp. PS02301]|uniref:Csu type fimbrial protein n=1 Tax=Stenotrophomonas sp. PS02301 TaxID=2991427 RepID=UPI00249ADB28|nr:spore coat U domain-containing protein [Stenotrophomonas sp. PS02301]
MIRALALLLVAALALFGSRSAHADTNCVVTTPVTLAFGTITNGSASVTNSTTTFTITCSTAALSLLATASVRACLGIGNGSGGSATQPTRSLRNATTDTMAFQLYTNATRSTIWGLTPGSNPGAQVIDLNYNVPLLTGGSGTVTVTIYGQVPAGQTLSAGSFSSSFAAADTTVRFAYNEVLLGTASPPPACTTPAGGGATGNKTVASGFPFTVTANVLPQCSTYVTTDMDFGSNAGAITGNIDRTSTIGLTCINRTAYTIGLDNGQHVLGTTTRRMQHATNPSYFIAYELYRDSGRSQRWGNTIGVDTVPGTGTGGTQTLTVYGRAPPTSGSLPAQGSYNDVITVNITY